MKRAFSIQPEAADEANDAFNWHENQQPGLGGEFYRELTRGFEFVLEHPLLARVGYRGLRKRKMVRFPYLIIYQATDAEVSVVSVFHGARNPAVWRRRAAK